MSMLRLFLSVLFLVAACELSAQSDSASVKKPAPSPTREDSMYLSRLNTSGTLMIAGGIGVCGAGSYLVYQGFKVYNSKVPGNNAEDISRNHKQGTAYIIAGGVGIIGGIVLIGFGARNKHEFMMRKRMMSLQSGLLDNGNIGFALNF